MKFLVLLALAIAPAVSFAGETCENYAKYFAIREYKSQGPVQGSDGIQYESELISETPTLSGADFLYEVVIRDNNEDGEFWGVYYEVAIDYNKSTQKCELVKVKEITQR